MRLVALVAIVSGAMGANSMATAAETRALLTRHDALTRALSEDPGVVAVDGAIQVAEAELREAQRWENPTLNFALENVQGSGPYSDNDQAETSLFLSQPLELGGDRGARRRVAESDVEAARIQAHLLRLDLIEQVEHAYVNVQAAEVARSVVEGSLRRAQAFLAQSPEPIIASGHAPLVTDTQRSLAQMELEVAAARRAIVTARSFLASYWGEEFIEYEVETESFNQVLSVPIDESTSSPDVTFADAQVSQAEAIIELERARAIPDVELEFGWRHFGETDDHALTFGASIALPLWDRNAAGVDRARTERDRTRRQRDARERTLLRERLSLRAQLDSAQAELEALQEALIVHRETTLSRALENYAQDRQSLGAVLSELTALMELRLRKVEAIRRYRHAEASLARLTGARAAERFIRRTSSSM